MSRISAGRFPAIAALAFSLLALAAGCRDDEQTTVSPALADRAGYSFRDGDRPIHEKTLAVADLEAFRKAGGAIVDVRLVEDFAADPAVIPGSERRDPDQILDWAEEYSKERPVALYCVKGKWVSQKAAAYLAQRGVNAYSVDGGLEAWKRLAEAQPAPTQPR